jgi:hypothetical protein
VLFANLRITRIHLVHFFAIMTKPRIIERAGLIVPGCVFECLFDEVPCVTQNKSVSLTNVSMIMHCDRLDTGFVSHTSIDGHYCGSGGPRLRIASRPSLWFHPLEGVQLYSCRILQRNGTIFQYRLQKNCSVREGDNDENRLAFKVGFALVCSAPSELLFVCEQGQFRDNAREKRSELGAVRGVCCIDQCVLCTPQESNPACELQFTLKAR